MILQPLAEAGTLAAVAPGTGAGLAWLRGFDPATPDGRYLIEGERVFALVSRYHTGPATEKRFETHRRYLDLQYLAQGRERILYLPLGGLEVETPYDEAKDITFYAEPKFSSSLANTRGQFIKRINPVTKENLLSENLFPAKRPFLTPAGFLMKTKSRPQ